MVFENPHFRLLRSTWALLGRSWGRLGAILGRLGPSWGDLGGVLGRLGGILGRLGGILGRLGAILGRPRGPLIITELRLGGFQSGSAAEAWALPRYLPSVITIDFEEIVQIIFFE